MYSEDRFVGNPTNNIITTDLVLLMLAKPGGYRLVMTIPTCDMRHPVRIMHTLDNGINPNIITKFHSFPVAYSGSAFNEYVVGFVGVFSNEWTVLNNKN